MTRYIYLYLLSAKMNIKTMLQYRMDFFIGFISTLLVQVTNIIFLDTIFKNIKSLAGWSYYEVFFVYGVFSLCRGFNHIFFDNLWIIGKEFIRKGTFDLFIIRPSNELFQIISQKLQPDGLGTLAVGIAVTIRSVKNLNIIVDSKFFIALVAIVFMGTGIIAAINLLFSVSSFWVICSNNIMWMIFSMADFAQYPLVLFGGVVKGILTFIIPYGFVSYYPVCYLLGKMDGIILLYEALCLVIIWLVALRMWKVGMKRYESTGN